MSEEDFKFQKENSYASAIYFDATLDYVAGRCCMLNAVFYRGHSLMCEAVEKCLKSFYFIDTKKEHPERRHNLLNIKNVLKKHIFLSKYDNLLSYLSAAHKARYTPNSNGFHSIQGSMYHPNDNLDEIDSLWMEMFDHLPFPDGIKFRLGVFIPSLIMPSLGRNYVWLTTNNKSLIPRLDELKLKGSRVMTGK